MKKISKISSGLYIFLCFAFFYLPILVTVIFSFNSSKSLTHFTGFSMRWYGELIKSSEIMSAVYVSLTIAILATIISTALGTFTAIGLSKCRKMLYNYYRYSIHLISPFFKRGKFNTDFADGTL